MIRNLGRNFLKLCMESPELAEIFIPDVNEVKNDSFRDIANIQLHGKIVGDFIGKLFV